MTRALIDRGPDDEGYYIDPAVGIALGHRRLAILDTSTAGRQPMRCQCGRFIIAYNGEVYNYTDMRRQLAAEGIRVTTGTDTEVILEAVCRWGLATALKRMVGMFAFALWDDRERRLYLVRDRLGEKPLYYWLSGDVVLCASDLRALYGHAKFQPTLDWTALTWMLRRGYVPGQRSIWQGVQKVQPGQWLAIERPLLDGPWTVTRGTYWSLEEAWRRAASHRRWRRQEEAVEELRALLRQLAAERLCADVPLGAFLSGGVDSSTLVALTQEGLQRPLRTFCLGIANWTRSETPYAHQVARYLGTEHTTIEATEEELCGFVHRLPAIWDEPFADPSQWPTALLCYYVRQHVKVAISGDGGDELFLGYPHYRKAAHTWGWLKMVPPIVRRLLAEGVWRLHPRRVIPEGCYRRWIQSLRHLLNTRSLRDCWVFYTSQLREPPLAATADDVISRDVSPLGVPTDEVVTSLAMHDYQHLAQWDLAEYVPDDLLVKLDRASMAVGLEVRVVYLDHRFVELAGSIPPAWNLTHEQGKGVLRRIAESRIPRTYFERKKTGFGLPLSRFLRGRLRSWAEDYLNLQSVKSEGILDPQTVGQLWNGFLNGDWRLCSKIWSILMFRTWYEAVKKQATCSTNPRPVTPGTVANCSQRP